MGLTLLELAEKILKDSPVPLKYNDIWKKAEELKLIEKLNITGKTPWRSLGALIFVDVRDNINSKFIKVGQRPARFFLKSRRNELPNNIIAKLEAESIKIDNEKVLKYNERDLHPLLSYYVYSNPSFSGAKGILTKTIYHEKSKKKGYNEWLHPDMVGIYFPLEDWDPNLIVFNKITGNNALKLYSFEIKKAVTKSNYRESYFQAVSNSSWANEGYLVVAEYQESDDDLSIELERLTMSFGIGIIKLDLEDIDSSKILFPAKSRTVLDWETMNKLCELNNDFKKFLQDIKIDYDSQRIHKNEYDQIISDTAEYISKKIMKI